MRYLSVGIIHIILGCFISLNAQIPDSLLKPWSEQVYVEPERQPGILDVTTVGLISGSSEDMSSKFAEILVEYPEYDSLYFPAGIYYFEDWILLSDNKVIFGDGSETVLNFAVEDRRSCITNRWQGALVSKNLDPLMEGDTIIYDNASSYKVGLDLYISSSEPDLMTSSWAFKSFIQFNKIKGISSDSSYYILEYPITRDRKSDVETGVFSFVENISISNLKIVNLTATEFQQSNIYFSFARNCKVSCIESESTNFAHVDVRNSKNIEVSGSYFHGAHAFGGGGQGYGTVLQFGSTECVVAGNIYDTLRHSILLQAGANNNVISSNYSINPYWEDVFLPDDSAGDLVLHGNWVTDNLFQHNIAQNIVIDDSHGRNGPGNTFFRNRAENYGIFMNNNPASDGQVFIANEITNSTVLKGLYFLNGEGHFRANNIIRGDYANGDQTLDELPVSLAGELLFPYGKELVGNIMHYNSVSNHAAIREGLEYDTDCEYQFYTSVHDYQQESSSENISYHRAIDLWKSGNYEIYDVRGKIYTGDDYLPRGIYFISSGDRFYKFIVE